MLFGKQPPKIDYDKMLNYNNKIPTRISPMRKNTTRQFSLENLLQNQIINPSYISPNENINMNGVNIEPIIQDTQLSNQESIIQPSENEIGNTDSQRFLASLLGQGISMFGAGIAGRNPSAVASNIEELRYYNDRLESERKAREERQKQEQEIFKERQLQRNESIKQSQDLMNPQSEISKRQRMLYSRFLGNIPEDVSASDLKDPVVLRGLQEQQMKLQMPKGGGVRQVSQPKEQKSDKKTLEQYTEHTNNMQSSLDVMDAVQKLNRTTLGRFTPDIKTSTRAEVGTIDRSAQPQVKVLAGPGTITQNEREMFLPLVTNSNMPSDLAIETTKRTFLEGTKKALAKLQADRSVGLISDSDANKIINEYNKYIKNPKLGLNMEISNDGYLINKQIPNRIKFSEE